MNDDLQNWITFLDRNRKRKRNEPEKDLNDLKLAALESLQDLLKNYNHTKRTLTSFLSNIENVFSKSLIMIRNDTKIEKAYRLSLLAFINVLIEIINEIKLLAYSNKSFDIKKFFKKEKAKYKNKKPKSNKDEKADSEDKTEEYEEDSEYESSDNEESPNQDKQLSIQIIPSKNKNLEMDDFIVEDEDYDDDDEDYDDDDEDYEDEDYDDDDEDEDEMQYDSINKDFFTELKKANTSFKDQKDESMNYFCNLKEEEKNIVLEKIKKINSYKIDNEPYLIKILNLKTSEENKKMLLNKFLSISNSMGDNFKIKTWLEDVLKIPFGKYCKNKINKKLLDKLKKKMDKAVFGHDHAKNHILQIMAQKIKNPKSKGHVLCIWGPPGNGKTTLIKEGIAKAMNKPFVFISLGGATDSSFLDGHSFTYEGSIYGRIAQGIIDSKCMDPIFYFDELDKVSNTPKGEEIINLLVHLIDPSQNSHFRDKYFHGLDLDLSKATFIFSFNDLSKINYILLDRIKTIETKYLTIEQKEHICNKYLIPDILKDIGLNLNSINIEKTELINIMNNYTLEGGVRKIKQILREMFQELNLLNLTNKKLLEDNVTFPISLDSNKINELLKNYDKVEPDKVPSENQIGIVNGLWAGWMGVGGVLPIETTLVPSNNIFDVKTTGSLEKVIKESISVALSVAWNKLDKEQQDFWLKKWKEKPESIHIHCPEGAVPKDGPSAGCALTLAIYSRLTNKKINHSIAMTGEINLQEEVMKIGGLEAKINGAKLAGIKTIFIPQDNVNDLEKIKIRNKNLLNDLEIIPVNKFNTILEKSLI